MQAGKVPCNLEGRERLGWKVWVTLAGEGLGPPCAWVRGTQRASNGARETLWKQKLSFHCQVHT